MEKYHMPMSNMQAPMPNMQAPYSKPMTSAMPTAGYAVPINVHASYEEINVYETKKHPHHCHVPAQVAPARCMSAGTLLVLYILLVIILRGFHK